MEQSVITREILGQIVLPIETKTYKPVSHTDLIENVDEVCHRLLSQHVKVNESFQISKNGQRMFGTMTFAQDQNEAVKFSVGFRNSYDKSMRVGVCVGANVTVCSNMVFAGDIVSMRKHSPNVHDDLKTMLLTAVFDGASEITKIRNDSEIMSDIEMSTDDGFKILGSLHGHNLLGLRQFTSAIDEWKKPSYEEFESRDAWSLYNAITNGLKSSPPNIIMESHIGIHNYFRQNVMLN